MWCLDPRTWEWNKVKKSGMPPGPRAGFSMCVHEKRALIFGGVIDMEMEVRSDEAVRHQLDELMFNDQPQPDYGIQVMYRFAGFDPFERFTYFGPFFDLGQI
ncbi:hypothetical protein OROHE_010563 [Orobanche hederae]